MLSKVKHSDPIYSILVKISIILFILFTCWLLYDHFINRPPEMRYYLSGNTAFKDKRYDTSLENYFKAFSYDQTDVYIIEGIARSYMELNDYENSLKYFDLAIKTDKEFAPAYANLGVLYDRKKDYINAIKYYDTALRLDKELSEGMHWIDRLLYDVREKPPTIMDRLKYLNDQMNLPENKRILSIDNINKEQINYEK